MKNIAMWLRLLAAVVGLTVVVVPSSVLAADNDDDRDHQSHIQRPMPGRDSGASAMCGGPLPGRPMCPLRRCGFLKVVVGVLALIHVMLAIWVFTDIRKRGEGHGIFVVLALLAGFPATILYALVRIGDSKRT
jgi:hypothetical protein